jgi:hypothetical protein
VDDNSAVANSVPSRIHMMGHRSDYCQFTYHGNPVVFAGIPLFGIPVPLNTCLIVILMVRSI